MDGSDLSEQKADGHVSVIVELTANFLTRHRAFASGSFSERAIPEFKISGTARFRDVAFIERNTGRVIDGDAIIELDGSDPKIGRLTYKGARPHFFLPLGDRMGLLWSELMTRPNATVRFYVRLPAHPVDDEDTLISHALSSGVFDRVEETAFIVSDVLEPPRDERVDFQGVIEDEAIPTRF
jgi:hypothetical protein